MTQSEGWSAALRRNTLHRRLVERAAERSRIVVKGAVYGQGPAPKSPPPSTRRTVPKMAVAPLTLALAKAQIDAARDRIEAYTEFLTERGLREDFRKWNQARTARSTRQEES